MVGQVATFSAGSAIYFVVAQLCLKSFLGREGIGDEIFVRADIIATATRR